MQLARVVLVSAAVAAPGVAATVLGFVAENSKFKSFVRFDGQRCVYRRTPGLVYGVVAALLALAALAIATAASGCCRRRHAPAPVPVHPRRRTVALRLSAMAWLTAVAAAVFFLYGAEMNRGGTRAMSASRWRRRYDGRYYYGCSVLSRGIFETAAVASAVATACAIAGYVCFQWAADEPAPPPPGQFVARPPPGVTMGQPQWAQPYPPPAPYPPPPMAYPAPPQYGHGGYGPKQPAGTA